MLGPGIVYDETHKQMLAYMFVMYSPDVDESLGRTSWSVQPWTLTAFKPRNEPYYTTVDTIQENLKETIEFSW